MQIDSITENKILKKKKKGKTIYKCPYCNYKGTKYNCVMHIEKVHSDKIPQGYTAARLFFNHINKKSHGSCIVCRRETQWNEDTWRYDRLCSPQCAQRYTSSMTKGMINKHGVPSLLIYDDHQKFMLNNRTISGEYRFQDGAIKSYTGKYERNLLEYFDKVMNAKSEDVQTPGPTIEYEYKGKTHLWITDAYYLPANLIIEVKDGGNNPNKRHMPEYREKVVAKEKALEKIGKYNYIRLTDNNFVEFAKTIEEIRENLDNDVKDIVFNVLEHAEFLNELGLASINPTIGWGSRKPIMVNQIISNSVINTGFCINDTDIMIIDKDGKVITKKFKDLDTDYVTRKSLDDNITDKIYDLSNHIGKKITEGYNPDFLYEYVTGNKILHNKQPVLDNRFVDFIDEYKKESYTLESMYNKLDPCICEFEPLPIMEGELNYNKAKKLVKNYDNLRVLENPYGFVVENINTGNMSRLYTSIEKIKQYDLDVVSGGDKYE